IRAILIVLTYLLYRPKVYYESDASPKGRIKEPMVLTCNHLRGCDGAVISAIFHRDRIHSIAARRWYRKWYLYPLLRCGYSIPIDNKSAAWLRASGAAIRQGDSVLIFPEGMAVPGMEIRPFKPGFLLLAQSVAKPVLPLYMEGCYNRPFFKRLRIVVGTPYVPGPPENGEMTREFYKQLCEILYNKTVALRALLAQRRSKRKSKSGKDTV
ncbi:MAG: 1-acyl-sn-glycerol-3-phosphate acyltransferase, partial [Clostridia bacterium]|nr:1-acyl-sn-glycerol-3-phosphate acyltransferase [Clostridia bacterium]